jgi:transcriptional regulator with XRE-family HTH domain
MSQTLSSSTIGRALRARREHEGLTLARVARESGVSLAELGTIESGRSQPSVAVLGRVARALGVSLVDLVRTNGAGAAGGAPIPRTLSSLSLTDIGRAITELPRSAGSKIDAVISAAVLHAMKECGDNQSAAARLLGMDRKAFIRRVQRARRRGRGSNRRRRRPDVGLGMWRVDFGADSGFDSSDVRARPSRLDAGSRPLR